MLIRVGGYIVMRGGKQSLEKEEFCWLQGSIAENEQWPLTTMKSFGSQASLYIFHVLFSD